MQHIFDADLATKSNGANRDSVTVEQVQEVSGRIYPLEVKMPEPIQTPDFIKNFNQWVVTDNEQANLNAYYDAHDNHDCTYGPEDGCPACDLMMEKLEHEAHL